MKLIEYFSIGIENLRSRAFTFGYLRQGHETRGSLTYSTKKIITTKEYLEFRDEQLNSLVKREIGLRDISRILKAKVAHYKEIVGAVILPNVIHTNQYRNDHFLSPLIAYLFAPIAQPNPETNKLEIFSPALSGSLAIFNST